MRIAIIGSGLSAWAALDAVKSVMLPNDSITVIDANKRFNGDTDFASSSGLKSKFGSMFVYDTRGSGLNFQEQSNFSMAHGGLSNTWGSGIRLWGNESLRYCQIDCSQIYVAAEALLSKIPFSGDEKSLNFPLNSRIVSTDRPKGSGAFDQLILKNVSERGSSVTGSALAVSVSGPNGCVGCGQCLRGCPYGSIFETSRVFDRETIEGSIKFVEGIVTCLEGGPDGTKVVYKSRLGELQFLEFDRVYLCAGAIGTPAILMKSKLLPSTMNVLDSQVFYFIGFSYFKKKPENKQFALAQANISSNSGDDPEFMCSLYLCNSDVRKKISELISSKLFGVQIQIPKFLDRILFLGIGFIDSKHSGSIQLDLPEKTAEIQISSIYNPESRKVIKAALRKIARTTRKSKMFTVTWFFQMPSAGAGFHSGASLPAGGEFVSESGFLRSINNVAIADVSILPFIKPGPHTFTSMAVNYATIKENLN